VHFVQKAEELDALIGLWALPAAQGGTDAGVAAHMAAWCAARAAAEAAAAGAAGGDAPPPAPRAIACEAAA
jgi:hypothetical protein